MVGTVSSLGVYPVKSLRGFAPDDAVLEPWGFAGDRRWLVVDPDHRYVTQRSTPAMALVRTRVRTDGTVELATDPAAATQGDPIALRPGTDRVTVEVCGSTVDAAAGEPAADRWLSAVLGRPVRLVHMDRPDLARAIDPEYARSDETVSFADGYPVLVTTTASLAAVNSWQREARARVVGMERFRPSIVVDTATPWVEDGWSELVVGGADGVRLRVARSCPRCVLTAVDPATGTKEPGGPLRQIGAHRPGVDFGLYVVPERTGTVRVGDAVEVAS